MNEWISSEVGLPTSLMASWAKSSGGGGGGIRRPPPSNNPNGSGPPQPHRAFRRPAPYPKPEERDNTQESYEEVDSQQHDYSGNMQYEGYQHQQNEVEMKSLSQRVSLYQKFYRQVQEQRKPADCVVLSVSSGSTDYPKSLGLCLQERGLSVEMLYLQAESGLTRALQDVRADGSPFCILVEQTNVSLSSCTVIIFSESLKIHRNMPKDQAMEFVTNEYGRGPSKQKNAPSDPADIAARSSELVDDFLEREKIERHVVPSETRQLLLLLAEGVHMYPEELGTIADYLRSRQDHAQASTAEGSRGNMLPPGLGKPPPLLPTPPGPPPGIPSGGGSGQSLAEALADHSPSQPTPLLSSSGSYPKTKPPPLLSLHRPPGPPHGPGPAQQGPSGPRGPPPSHNPYGAPGPRGPPPHHVPPYHLGPRGAPPHGIRGPPSLRSLRPQAPLLANPGGPPPRPNGPRR